MELNSKYNCFLNDDFFVFNENEKLQNLIDFCTTDTERLEI